MREILFKAKTAKENEWIQSMTISNGIINRKSRDLFMEIGYNKWKKIRPETLCQFTGLLDKNGNKIFEGDRIRKINHFEDVKETIPVYLYHKIVWYNNAWFQAWNEANETPETGNGNCALWIYKPWIDAEIIGNIHENEGK